MQYKYSTPPFIDHFVYKEQFNLRDKLYDHLTELATQVTILNKPENLFLKIYKLDSELDIPYFEKKIWRLQRLVKAFGQKLDFLKGKITHDYIQQHKYHYTSLPTTIKSYIEGIQENTSTQQEHIETVHTKTLKQFHIIESYENTLQFMINELVDNFNEIETYYFELKTDISKIALQIQRNEWKNKDQEISIQNTKLTEPKRVLILSTLTDMAYLYFFDLFNSTNENEESSNKNEKYTNSTLEALINIASNKLMDETEKKQWIKYTKLLISKNRIEYNGDIDNTMDNKTLENQFSYFLPRFSRLYQLYQLDESDLRQEVNDQKKKDLESIYPNFYKKLKSLIDDMEENEVDNYIEGVKSDELLLKLQMKYPMPIESKDIKEKELDALVKPFKNRNIVSFLPISDRKKLVKFSDYTINHKHILYNTKPLVASPDSYTIKQITQQSFKLKQDKKTDRKIEGRISLTNYGSTAQTNSHSDGLESPTITIIYEPILTKELLETKANLKLLLEELSYVQELLAKVNDWYYESKVELSKYNISDLAKLPSNVSCYKEIFISLQTIVNNFDPTISKKQSEFIINTLKLQFEHI